MNIEGARCSKRIAQSAKRKWSRLLPMLTAMLLFHSSCTAPTPTGDKEVDRLIDKMYLKYLEKEKLEQERKDLVGITKVGWLTNPREIIAKDKEIDDKSKEIIAEVPGLRKAHERAAKEIGALRNAIPAVGASLGVQLRFAGTEPPGKLLLGFQRPSDEEKSMASLFEAGAKALAEKQKQLIDVRVILEQRLIPAADKIGKSLQAGSLPGCSVSLRNSIVVQNQFDSSCIRTDVEDAWNTFRSALFDLRLIDLNKDEDILEDLAGALSEGLPDIIIGRGNSFSVSVDRLIPSTALGGLRANDVIAIELPPGFSLTQPLGITANGRIKVGSFGNNAGSQAVLIAITEPGDGQDTIRIQTNQDIGVAPGAPAVGTFLIRNLRTQQSAKAHVLRLPL